VANSQSVRPILIKAEYVSASRAHIAGAKFKAVTWIKLKNVKVLAAFIVRYPVLSGLNF
jgi:hypothetical protein